ncbi:DUF4440 domain-containing protein [Dryocola sp. BD626]|jgi:hypothetical protein|uniref:DUF4440 domain-containing protein n=1 Tax=Dryocola sp. BD626 TaxID=3133273 RepID=UPI003F50082A
MNPYVFEVIDAHVAIESWLGKGEGDVEALLARFAPAFTMVATSGARLDFARLCGFFRGQPAAKPGLKIKVADIAVIAEWPDGALVSYSEIQTLPGEAGTLRHSTVAFSRTNGGVRWLRLHETAAA